MLIDSNTVSIPHSIESSLDHQKPIAYYLLHYKELSFFLVPHNPAGFIPAMQELVLTGREVGGNGATHERPTGGVHGDSIVGARKQVNKLEFLTDSINQDGLSCN